MDELKPCPFCGGIDIDWDDDAHAMFCMACNTVGPETVKPTKEAAIAAWNVRA